MEVGGGTFWADRGGWTFFMNDWVWVGVGGCILWLRRCGWTFFIGGWIWVGGGGWTFFIGGWVWVEWVEVYFG